MTTNSQINWKADVLAPRVLATRDFELRYTSELQFKSLPFAGKPGYQLLYRPTGHVQAEGVDIVAAIGQTYREQRILDRVKAKPSLLEDDPSQAQLAEFLQDADTGKGAAN